MVQRKRYEGPERRVHHVYVTANTEYHVRRGVCVAVKRRAEIKEDAWVNDHLAVAMHLDGYVKPGTMLPLPGPPKLGHRIYFANEAGDVLTSPVIAILRPPKAVVEKYPPDNNTATKNPSA